MSADEGVVLVGDRAAAASCLVRALCPRRSEHRGQVLPSVRPAFELSVCLSGAGAVAVVNCWWRFHSACTYRYSSLTLSMSEDDVGHDQGGSTQRKRGRMEPPSPSALSLAPPRRVLPPHRLVLAPMVGGSELAFRLLARRHGAELCYTPMIKPEDWARPGGGVSLLERHPDGVPLVAHFGGNDPDKLLACAKRAERCPGVAAVDLNLGCPQRSAHSGHFGAFLCVTDADRQLVLRIVTTLARGLRVPVFCKIRLLDDVDETLRFAGQLQAAGCALLAVHGRYRGSPMHRRDGPAHLDQIQRIKAHLSIPVLSNGNVRDAAELVASLEATGADGVMSAEGALDDPAIFARAAARARRERRQLRRLVSRAKALRAERANGRRLTPEERAVVAGRKPARERLRRLPRLPKVAAVAADGTPWPSAPLDLAEQYLELARLHPPPGGAEAAITHGIFHVRRLLRALMTQYELLPTLKACTSMCALCRALFASAHRSARSNTSARPARACMRGCVSECDE